MGRDVDAEFAAIVAGFHAAEATALAGGRGRADDMPADVTRAARRRGRAPGRAAPQAPGGASPLSRSSGWDDLLGRARPRPRRARAEEGATPAAPTAAARGTTRDLGRLGGGLGGPACCSSPSCWAGTSTDWVMLLAAPPSSGGFVALVARLGDRPDDDGRRRRRRLISGRRRVGGARSAKPSSCAATSSTPAAVAAARRRAGPGRRLRRRAVRHRQGPEDESYARVSDRAADEDDAQPGS